MAGPCSNGPGLPGGGTLADETSQPRPQVRRGARRTRESPAELIGRIDSLRDGETIYAADASPTAVAVVGRELDSGEAPPEAAGLQYFLEVAAAKEAVQVWSAWRDGVTPTLDDKVVAVIHYASYDSYLPTDEPPK